MTRLLRKSLPWFALLAACVLAWWALHRPPPAATWLEAAAPAAAGTGQPFPARIRILRRPPGIPHGPLVVSVHLHGRSVWGAWNYVIEAESQPMALGRWLYFDVPVPADADLYKAFLLVFLSPSGEWADRVYYMRSRIFRVHPGELGTPEGMQPLKFFDRGPVNPAARVDSEPARLAISVGWLACALAWWRRMRPAYRAASLLAALALAASVSEILSAGSALAGAVRSLVIAHGWYALRYGYQQILTFAILFLGGALVILGWQRIRATPLRLGVAGLGLYAAVTLAALVSMHEMDAVLSTPLLSVPLLQILQLAAVSLALLGALLPARAQ
jgi:hypothetical protein